MNPSKIIQFMNKYYNKLSSSCKWFWDKYVHRQLKARKYMKIKTIDKFIEHIEETKHPYFPKYLKGYEAGIPIHQSLINYLQIDFKEKKVLDIGPGLGAFLDLASKGGAKTTEFFDSDPLFWRYLKFNGHKGWVLNYKLFSGFFPFNLLKRKRYDIVLSRGSINGDDFNVLSNNSHRRFIKFPQWIKQVESMVAPNGIIIITPTYRSENPKWVCTDPDKFRLSHFSKVLLDSDYEILPIIDGYGHEETWPFTFHKRC